MNSPATVGGQASPAHVVDDSYFGSPEQPRSRAPRSNAKAGRPVSAAAQKTDADDGAAGEVDLHSNLLVREHLQLYFREYVFKQQKRSKERFLHLFETSFVVFGAAEKEDDRVGRGPRQLRHNATERRSLIVLTTSSVFILEGESSAGATFKDRPQFPLIAAHGLEEVLGVAIGWFGQRLRLEFAGGHRYVLLTRSKALSYEILQALTPLCKGLRERRLSGGSSDGEGPAGGFHISNEDAQALSAFSAAIQGSQVPLGGPRLVQMCLQYLGPSKGFLTAKYDHENMAPRTLVVTDCGFLLALEEDYKGAAQEAMVLKEALPLDEIELQVVDSERCVVQERKRRFGSRKCFRFFTPGDRRALSALMSVARAFRN